VGIWVAVLGIGIYVLNMGMWVGAADEKLADAATVEETQKQVLLDLNTVQVTQAAQTVAIADNKKATEKSRDEILAAIEKAHAE
jgi:Flp pilus assembly protein protease CpaA